MPKLTAIAVISVLLAGLAFSTTAAADCVLPSPPSRVPDGNSANEQEMVAAMRTLKQYNDDVTIYTKCLEFEMRQNRITAADQEKHRDDALSALTTIASRFNEQVRRFKGRKS